MKTGKSLGVLTRGNKERHSPGDVGHQVRKSKSNQVCQKHTGIADAVEQAVQQRSTFTSTTSHDQATTEE